MLSCVALNRYGKGRFMLFAGVKFHLCRSLSLGFQFPETKRKSASDVGRSVGSVGLPAVLCDGVY